MRFNVNPKPGEIGVDWYPHITVMPIRTEVPYRFTVAPFLLVFGYAFRIGRFTHFWLDQVAK
jgi:hypothetical protein